MKLINFGLFAVLAITASTHLGSAAEVADADVWYTRAAYEGCKNKNATLPIALPVINVNVTGMVCVDKLEDVCGSSKSGRACPELVDSTGQPRKEFKIECKALQNEIKCVLGSNAAKSLAELPEHLEKDLISASLDGKDYDWEVTDAMTNEVVMVVPAPEHTSV